MAQTNKERVMNVSVNNGMSPGFSLEEKTKVSPKNIKNVGIQLIADDESNTKYFIEHRYLGSIILKDEGGATLSEVLASNEMDGKGLLCPTKSCTISRGKVAGTGTKKSNPSEKWTRYEVVVKGWKLEDFTS